MAARQKARSFFRLDGTQYEIDLSTGHAKELRAALARYLDAGRKVTGPARRAGQNGRKVPAIMWVPEILSPVRPASIPGSGRACLLGNPFAGRVGGDSGQTHPAGAVLDEEQDVRAAQEDGVDVEEVRSQDRRGLPGQEPPLETGGADGQ
jgi:hypothetical protein